MNKERARESSHSIERMYVTMRHLFYQGVYKVTGTAGESLRKLLLNINPEIYGSISDPNKVELNGLQYVLDRLPEGVEEAPYIHLTSDEGFQKSSLTPIIPKKRRRNCYRVDDQQMNIEILLGRSEIYDVLTHLTFLYNEADKIRSKVYNQDNKPMHFWSNLEKLIHAPSSKVTRKEREVMLIQLSTVLGRSFDEVLASYKFFQEENNPDRFLKIIYHMGENAQKDFTEQQKREIYFSPILRERIGQHIFGEKWANTIKKTLVKHKLQNRPIHIISANMHSVKNMLYAHEALEKTFNENDEIEVYEELSNSPEARKQVLDYATNNGMIYIDDKSGSNIDVQIFDLSKINLKNSRFKDSNFSKDDIILVFDYAFGEQAYEVMDELLKPYDSPKQKFRMNIASISIMGKAGILEGDKGDIMIPDSHIFEGTADNYPFKNDLEIADLEGNGLKVFKGGMISVLGTSLQNKDLLTYFKDTSWKAIGLEMEGAHYQKAIQVASKIRNHIDDKVALRYAYYASDNPLHSGSTLASGGLGLTGVKPTYLITQKILEQILHR